MAAEGLGWCAARNVSSLESNQPTKTCPFGGLRNGMQFPLGSQKVAILESFQI
jgi:hypothetical protein